MISVTIEVLDGCGILSKIFTSGGSVAKARAARVSMIRFTHNIWTAVKGESLSMTEPKKTMNIATTLTVN
jgi:hypothetical protein